jgi:hypothetical protein
MVQETSNVYGKANAAVSIRVPPLIIILWVYGEKRIMHAHSYYFFAQKPTPYTKLAELAGRCILIVESSISRLSLHHIWD